MGSFFLTLECLECHAQDCTRMHHLKGKCQKFLGGSYPPPPIELLRTACRQSRGESALHFNLGLPHYKILDQPLSFLGKGGQNLL